ncbi:MAG: hypothetical protein RBS88_06585 [Spongiibacteraceae bacterium]|jgi:hypothetical protein|nr:hypothetical protein [Spongiibacteraceae bacterium]
MSRFFLVVLIAALLAGCSSASYSPTAFPYEINEERIKEANIRRVIIASANVSGEPTRHHLQQPAARIDRLVKQYLEQNGYQVVDGHHFENAWNQAIRTYGDIYDPTTGRVDGPTWNAVMVETLSALAQRGDVDAVIFTDVIEHEVAHNIGLEHLAQWWGVSRKPHVARQNTQISTDFNWNQPVRAASLVITIYLPDLTGVFASRGGLDTIQSLDGRTGSGRWVRRKNMLESEKELMEGIRLAFHPFIPMQDYPGRR